MRTRYLLLSTLPLLATAALTAQSQVRLPAGGSFWRLGTQPVDGPFTLQQIVSGDRLPARTEIRDLGLRVFSYYPGRFEYGGRFVQIEVQAGHTRKTVRTMTTDLAANRTVPLMKVFDGSVQLPTLDSNETAKPFKITFQKPFVYQRAQGDLLLQIELKTRLNPYHGNACNFAWYGLEVSYMRAFGVFDRRGTGGKVEKFESHVLFHARVTLDPRTGNAEMLVTTPAHGPTWFLLGTQQDSLSLQPFGAPGSTLYVKPLVVLPSNFRMSLCSSSYQGIRQELPLGPELVRSGLIVQAATLSPSDNQLGVVLSDALDVTLTSLDNGGTQSMVDPQGRYPSFLNQRPDRRAGGFAGLTLELGLGPVTPQPVHSSSVPVVKGN